MNAAVFELGVLLIAAVLGLAWLSARLWRRTHPAADRFTRFQQWRIFSGLWMGVAAVTVAVLVATHVITPQR